MRHTLLGAVLLSCLGLAPAAQAACSGDTLSDLRMHVHEDIATEPGYEGGDSAIEMVPGEDDSAAAHDACAPGDTAVVIGTEGCDAISEDQGFDACFDMDGDGVPEGFSWAWEERKDKTKFTVHRRIGGEYRELYSRSVESLGFDSEAWFLREPPRAKALFTSRSGGSAGLGLYSLDWERQRLVPVNREFYFTSGPDFRDLDGDGQREILLAGRGHVRMGGVGVAVYRWNGERYAMWWPDWPLDEHLWSFPYPVDGRLVDVDADGRPEMVALLDTERHTREKWERDQFEGTRALGIWSLGPGGPKLLARCDLPRADCLWYPALGAVERAADRATIDLAYENETVVCTFAGGALRASATRPREAETEVEPLRDGHRQ